MFFAGDEFCNTQFGNNNAYCQDNIISWLDWNRLEEYREIHDFARFMIRFRKEHPILRKQTSPSSGMLPQISVHNGVPYKSTTEYNSHLIGVMYAGRDLLNTRDDIVFYAMNAYWESLTMQLPPLTEGMQWKAVANTFFEYSDDSDYHALTEWIGPCMIRIPPRTTIVLVAEPCNDREE